MTTQKKTYRERLLAMPRWAKRSLLIANDFIVLSFALWAAFSMRLNTLYVPPDKIAWLLFLLAPLIGVATFYFRGLYRLVTRFFQQEAAGRIYITIALAVLVWSLTLYLIGLPGVPRSVVIIYGFFAAALTRMSRQTAGWILQTVPNVTLASLDHRDKVLIYGAGETGIDLLRALQDSNYQAIGFLDDSPSLWGQNINRLKVYNPDKLAKLIRRDGVKEVFLALSSSSIQERRRVIQRLEDYPVTVKTLPALEDIASGKVEISDLRPIDVEDLLGRDPVPPDTSLLGRDIKNKNVLITGAGGSIGSELTRQIINLAPKRLVLLDVSEAALYQIGEEANRLLRKIGREAKTEGTQAPKTKVVTILGSVLDGDILSNTLQTHDIETIYHAAAYKHVPIVEENPFVGLRNNTFGTLSLAATAMEYGVQRMVLISTDKAVRPTSIMGASKRLAELVLQGLSAEKDSETVFTMVRFGNVLDSSGSVVRLFRQQIREGGPVTVTHPQIIRYFMSIPEAAELVLQAGAMAQGGEVFVLDMGSPVKIDDLARTMIHLSGLQVRDKDHPEGEIEIEYVGLRQGEKLYEELLIGENTTGTQHPRIMKNSEPFLDWPVLSEELQALEQAIDDLDVDELQTILKRTVEGYATAQQTLEIDDEGAAKWGPGSRLVH